MQYLVQEKRIFYILIGDTYFFQILYLMLRNMLLKILIQTEKI